MLDIIDTSQKEVEYLFIMLTSEIVQSTVTIFNPLLVRNEWKLVFKIIETIIFTFFKVHLILIILLLKWVELSTFYVEAPLALFNFFLGTCRYYCDLNAEMFFWKVS